MSICTLRHVLLAACLAPTCLTTLACSPSDVVEAPGRIDRDVTAADTAAVRAMAAWNAIALRTTASGPFSPPRETRAMAMVSAAVFDAVNSLTGEYEPYAVQIVTPPAATALSAEAAVVTAAHAVLRALYPSAQAALDAAYDSSFAGIASGADREAGVAAGEAAAAAIVARRLRDHAADTAHYVAGSGAGVWIPTPPAFAAPLEAGWGKVTPFFLDSASQFRPGPPPAIGSAAYDRDLTETLAIGIAGSTTRTAPQTEVARFWIATAPQLWNQVVRELTVRSDIDAVTAARAYLALNLAGADAMIAAWEAKFTYNQWRPVTAIRAAVGGDTAWMPLLVTPPFPDYPAGHTSYGGAAETVLAEVFGAQPGELSIVSATAGGVTHRYQSVHEVADEVVNARVWGGVHWRTSSEAGRELGRRVGEWAIERLPRRMSR